MTETEKWIEDHIGELVEDICRLVEIPSVSEPGGPPEAPYGGPCKEALLCALAIGERMGFLPANHENYCGSLLWKGKKEEEIGFFGHADVVPAGSGWTGQPFAPEVKDGLIFGRGAADNKGSFLAALYALRYLKESGYQPEHSCRFVVGCNEERGMEDIQYYAEHYREPVFSLVPDVMFPVCNGEKGTLELDAECPVACPVLLEFSSGIMSNAVPADAAAVLSITKNQAARLKDLGGEVNLRGDGAYHLHVSGIAAHAAFPEGSESAEVKLAQMLLDAGILDEDAKRLMLGVVRMFQDYYGVGLGIPYSDDISGRLTHVGGIACGKDGVFRQNINIRYPITADYEQMIERIVETLGNWGFYVTQVKNSAPCYVKTDSEEVQKLVAICNRHLGMELEPYVMGGGTYARKLKRAVGFGPGIPGKTKRFGTERGGAHQPDEYVEIEHLKKAFLIYVDAVQELDNLHIS